jgi:hypothetical protein
MKIGATHIQLKARCTALVLHDAQDTVSAARHVFAGFDLGIDNNRQDKY